MASKNSWQTSVSIFAGDFCRERMHELNESGIHHIEFTGLNYSVFEDFLKNAQEIFNTAKEEGVTIRSIHLPFSPFSEIDPASPDSAVRDRFIEVQRPIIEAAAKCGIEIAVIHPSGEPYPEDKRGEHIAWAIDSLKKLQKIIADNGMKLAIENLPRTCLGRNCADMKIFLDAIPDAYACFDSNHSLKDSNIDLIKTMGNSIIATHISDYDFIDERHLFPGEGKNGWQDIIAALEEVGYKGTWNYEIKDSNTFAASVYKDNHNKLLKGEIK